MGADDAPAAPMCESAWRRSRASCPRPAIGRDALVVSSRSTKTRSISSSIVAVSRERFSTLGSSGAKSGSRRLRAQRRVQLAGDHAEVAARAARSLEVLERELPAVARAGEVLLQRAERDVHQPPLVLVPADQRRDVRESRAERKRSTSSSGLTPGSSAPERLQDQRCRRRRSRSWTARRRPGARRPCRPRRRRPTPPSGSASVPSSAATSRRAAHAVQQLAPVRGVGEGVVDRPAVEVLGDHALGPPSAAGRRPMRHLVDLVRPGPEVGLDEREHEQRRLVAQRTASSTLKLGDVAVLRREPALVEDPLVQLLLGQRGEQAGGVSHAAPPRPRRAGTSRSRAARASAGTATRRRPGSGSGRRSPPGWRPSNSDRSSSTACAERARLCTHSITSSS